MCMEACTYYLRGIGIVMMLGIESLYQIRNHFPKLMTIDDVRGKREGEKSLISE